MTRSSARLLNINVNSLTNDTPSKKRKIGNDDSKEAIKRMKLNQKSEEQITLSCNQMASKNGNAEKKRQLYKRALGFNGNEAHSRKMRAKEMNSAAPEVNEIPNSAQLVDTNELNSSKGVVVKKRNVNENVFKPEKNVQVLSEPSASLPITNVSNHEPQNNIVAKVEFKINEVIWCKIRGSPTWPCKIKSFVKNMAIVVWFNDYRITKVYRTQLQKFLINFDTHAQNFDTNIRLKTAAKEALLYYGNGLSR